MRQGRTVEGRGLARASALAALSLALVLAICAFGFALSPAGGELIASDASGAAPESGEIIVVYGDGGDPASAEDAVAESDVAVEGVEDLGTIAGGDEGALLVSIAEGENLDDAIGELSQSDGVLYAQPNYTYELMEDDPVYTIGGINALADSATNDSKLDEQYYLKPWKSAPDSYGSNVLAAWERQKVEGSVTIAVLDSGVLATHEDLQANLDTEHMCDIYSGGEPGEISDPVGHGTHVTGIAGAVANNGKGIAGVSYNARILPLKVFSDEGKCKTSDLLNGFGYLTDLVDAGELDDLHVINMSLGDYSASADDNALRSAISTMRNDHQVLTVCAGGNGNGPTITSPCYPGDFEEALAVTALKKDGENRPNSDYNLSKDISAPGTYIYSTTRSNDSSYGMMHGTSMSTPIVSGIAALLWAYNPNLTADQVVEAMKSTAHPLDPEGSNYHMTIARAEETGGTAETGSVGAVDACAALGYAQAHFPPLRDATIDPIPDVVYDGTAHEPSLTVTAGDTKLVEGTDYTVAYERNVDAGTAGVTITGINGYEGILNTTFKILPVSIEDAEVSGVVDCRCNGWARTQDPTVTLEVGGEVVMLEVGTDYKLSYKDNVNPGTATMTITGTGNFTGSISRTFAIGQVWYRVWGSTAHDTMREVAKEFGSAKTAVVTTSTSFKDALAASALAGRYNAIVLVTDKASLTKQARASLVASGVQTVYIVGSTANVPAKVESQIKAVPSVKTVKRIAATTPSQRAVAIAKKTGGSSDTVIIATQNDYRDALAIAPYAYVTKSPILYAETSKKLSAETTAYLKSAGYTKAIVVGGPLALPASVDMQLRVAGIKQANITRLAGANAYETSVLIADWATGALQKRSYGTYNGAALAYVRFQPSVKLSANKLAVATGQDWRDAVCGAALCGKNRAVMLLADSKTAKSKYAPAASWCTAHKSQVQKAYVLGGTSAVSAKVWNALLVSTE